jgi:hypothetical protein
MWCGSGGEEKKSLSLQGIEPQPFNAYPVTKTWWGGRGGGGGGGEKWEKERSRSLKQKCFYINKMYICIDC